MSTTNKISKIISKISLDKNSSILKTLEKMDELNMKLLIVTEKSSFLSVISIGDIQRAIIKGKSLDSPVSKILRHQITVCHETDDMSKIKSEMIFHRAEFMPILNSKREIVNIIFWKDIFSNKRFNYLSKLDMPVVIMAGGKGTRLRPLTNHTPKPLVPLGDKTIIELILNSFVKIGIKKFYLLINYKANVIENYFKEKSKKKFNIEFVLEDKPLGTAGSLYLLKNRIDCTFFISNCDILIDQDYSEVYKFHKENNNEMTIIGALKHYYIPYGMLEVKSGGFLKVLKEKPKLTFMINSGMYIFEPHILNEIPEKKFFHITELIEKIKNRNGRIGVFPVSEMSWLDIGNWEEFNRTEEIFLKKKLI